jgi:hypothetical protein
LAALHGVDWRWLLTLLATWSVVILAARIGLPQVDPDPVDRSHPLERLSNFALMLPVMVQTSALTVHVPWIENLRAVHVRTLQPAWLGAQWCCGVTAAIVISMLALPYGVDAVHVTGVWVLLFAIASLAAASHTETALRYSAGAIFAVIGTMTFPGLVPWPANVLYNGETTAALWGLGLALTSIALVVPVLKRQ